MAKILGIILALACAVVGFHFTMSESFENPYPVVCDLVSKKIYLDDKAVEKWQKTCLRRARLVTPYSKKQLIIKDINNVLALLKVSHLSVFDPSEVRRFWRGRDLETGIESEFVDSELMIFKVHPQSPAEKAGLHRGDIIATINGEQPSPWEAVKQSGTYVVRNIKGERVIPLKAAEIQRDERMQLIPLTERRAQWVVPSFRKEFFTEEELNRITVDFKFYKELVIDLRGNSGGNFVAGLRFLSTLICQPTVVGSLTKPRMKDTPTAFMPNDLDDSNQLALLDKSRTIVLRTFGSKECFKGPVKVLVDGKTASTAELSAQALKEHRGAPLMGAPSQGELLVGVWYPLDELSKGAQISIPEAVYVTVQGYQIENQGVKLDRVLYYNLPEMQAGIDSWVKKALDYKP